jgi:hypothetical protein
MAIIAGKNGTTGVGLVEIYNLQLRSVQDPAFQRNGSGSQIVAVKLVKNGPTGHHLQKR